MNLKDIIISESTDIEFKQRISFDALSTKEKFDDASFTLFKSIFKKALPYRLLKNHFRITFV